MTVEVSLIKKDKVKNLVVLARIDPVGKKVIEKHK